VAENRDAGLAALTAVVRMNTGLFERCLDGVTDQDATKRPGGANSMAFIFLHVADARYYLAGLVGPALDNPLGQYTDVRSIGEAKTLPSLEDLRAAWREVSPVVEQRLQALEPDAWSRESPASFPIPDGTLLGATAFLIQHESYHLGQLGLLRRQLGYPGMEWKA
jgi:uncharacterized damage-inducible protein DinB